MKATTKQTATSNNNKTNVTNVKESAVSKALKLKTTTTKKEEQMKTTTTTTTKNKKEELPKEQTPPTTKKEQPKEKKEVVVQADHLGINNGDIVMFTDKESKEYKGYVLRRRIVRGNGKSRCIMYLIKDGKVSKQKKSVYTSIVTFVEKHPIIIKQTKEKEQAKA
jgi:hypothetical protein